MTRMSCSSIVITLGEACESTMMRRYPNTTNIPTDLEGLRRFTNAEYSRFEQVWLVMHLRACRHLSCSVKPSRQQFCKSRQSFSTAVPQLESLRLRLVDAPQRHVGEWFRRRVCDSSSSGTEYGSI